MKRDRIGAVGWCMGGGYALQLAIAAPTLKAVAINYGALATDKAALAKIHAAVLGNFGGQDHGIPPDAVHAFEAAMQSLGKPVDAKIYPDAGHAFENPNNRPATGRRRRRRAGARRPLPRSRTWKTSGLVRRSRSMVLRASKNNSPCILFAVHVNS